LRKVLCYKIFPFFKTIWQGMDHLVHHFWGQRVAWLQHQLT
jgi:hypothetical protein